MNDLILQKLSVLTHTHSKCFDVFDIYREQMEKCFHWPFEFCYNLSIPHYVLSDEPPFINMNWEWVEYKDKWPFSLRVLTGTESISEDYCLFMLEDYIPYQSVSVDMVADCIKVMEEDKDVDFVRLLQSGAPKLEDYNDNYYVIDPNASYIFTTQATIWRKEVLGNIMNGFVMERPQNEIEMSIYYKYVVRKGLCTTQKGNQVGGHFDSKILPYIATAIRGGKWNTSEYGPTLDRFFKTFDVDPMDRGTI